MEEAKQVEDKNAPGADFLKTWLIRAGILIVVFLVGFLPMLVYNRQVSSDLKAKDTELRRTRILNTLSSTAIYARRGEYETARQNASIFFTKVRQEMDSGEAGILSVQERQDLENLMTVRDEIITLLSRNDPASAEKLSNLYVEYTAVVRSKH